MNIDLKTEKFFNKKYFSLVNECGNFISTNIDKIEKLPDGVAIFEMLNNRELINELIKSYNKENDDNDGLLIINLATILKEITSGKGKIEVEKDDKQITVYKFVKREDKESYYTVLCMKESKTATKKEKLKK